MSIGVTDNGPGIAPEHLQVIFERFRQVGGNAKANEKGYGLGLSIAKELVHINLGDIEVESTPGEGTTFRFSVPAFDVGGIARRFVDKMMHHSDRPSSLSLIAVRMASPAGPAVRDDVGRFLQRQMRRCELLLPADERRWLICAAVGLDDVERMLARFRAALTEANLNRPGDALPELDYDVLGTWPATSDCNELIAAFTANCALDGGASAGEGGALPAVA